MKLYVFSHRIIRNPLFSILLAIIILYLDYITGPEIQFPVLFILPVILVTCYKNIYWGVTLSVLLPVVSTYYIYLWNDKQEAVYIIINVVIRISMFSFISFLISVVARQKKALSERVSNLEKFLPICSYCKKIRDKDNKWHSIESYITGKTDTEFSHGLCPDCAKKYYKDYLKQ